MFFFFQAEDGIRDRNVTGVQTCALPIYQTVIATCGTLVAIRRCDMRRMISARSVSRELVGGGSVWSEKGEIGRASCRERVESWVVAGACEGVQSVILKGAVCG